MPLMPSIKALKPLLFLDNRGMMFESYIHAAQKSAVGHGLDTFSLYMPQETGLHSVDLCVITGQAQLAKSPERKAQAA